MANSCTQGGAALQYRAQHCARCGTAVADAGFAQTSDSGTPRNTGKARIFLILLAVLVGVGIFAGMAAMFHLWGPSQAAQVEQRGEDARIPTPMGAGGMGGTEVTEADLENLHYPGAQQVDEGKLPQPASEGSDRTYTLQTADSPEQVLEFYRDRLGDAVDIVATPQGGIITSVPGKLEGYMITVGRDEDNARTVINVIPGIAAR